MHRLRHCFALTCGGGVIALSGARRYRGGRAWAGGQGEAAPPRHATDAQIQALLRPYVRRGGCHAAMRRGGCHAAISYIAILFELLRGVEALAG